MSALLLASSTPELLWSSRSADERRLLRSQTYVLGPLLAATIAMPFLPLAALPEPVVEVIAEVTLTLLPPPPLPPPPPPPRQIIPEPARPTAVPKPVQAPAARPAAERTLAALSRELAALGAGSNVLQSTTGAGNLSKGSASSTGSGTLREGTSRGSGGIGQGASGNFEGTGIALSGHGTERVTESGSGTGRGSGSGVPGRSTAEIQAVFERHKAKVDQLYQDGLAQQPGMQGEVLLQLVIQPDGRVSDCKILHSALQNAALEKKLVEFVSSLNFGAKAVPAQAVNYPIRLFQS